MRVRFGTVEEFLEELGDLLIKVQDFAAAREVVQTIQPPTATSLALLGECEWNLGRKENAAKLVAHALQLDPTHIRAGLLKADDLSDDELRERGVTTFTRVDQVMYEKLGIARKR